MPKSFLNVFNALITPAVLPACSPSLLPLIAVELALSQLLVDRVMSFTHPSSKVVSITQSRLVSILHPRTKVIGANPTWV